MTSAHPQQSKQPMLARPHSNPTYAVPPRLRRQQQMTRPAYTRSISQPTLPNNSQSQSGIVLQTVNPMQQPQPIATAHHLLPNDASMAMQLQQFSKYSAYQLQAALAAYPTWLQKEYVRRLQRQYDELYTIEDPKILHASSICPRKADKPLTLNAFDTSTDILSDSEHSEYLSESANLSPSPYAYSAHDVGSAEPTQTKFVFDETTIGQNKDSMNKLED